MRKAGAVVAAAITAIKSAVRPGITTADLDEVAEREIRSLGAIPTFKGYRGFPASICTSVNEEIVHGIPGDRVLLEGDLLKVDVGATVEGLIGDAAVTIPVGRISDEAQELIRVTEQALEQGIKAAVGGARTGDVGSAIEEYVKAHEFSGVREYVGHGVGRFLHEDPQVPNYGPAGMGPLLRPSMAIAIEPMVNVGGWKTRLLEDQWTVITEDGSLSSHFEHTIVITDGEPEVLTRER